jgi:hypothetical protein
MDRLLPVMVTALVIATGTAGCSGETPASAAGGGGTADTTSATDTGGGHSTDAADTSGAGTTDATGADGGPTGDASADAASGSAPPLVEDVTVVVPSAGIPPEAALGAANNNLDVTWHDGRLYLAFRTAPNHFASAETALHVVSSTDEVTWRWEGTFARQTDLREPRLLSWDGRLWLYFAVLGASPLDFEPEGSMVTELLSPGKWSDPEWFGEEGFIPWRVRVVDGRPMMAGYVGGENIYDVDGEPIRVHWLQSDDGETWEPVVPGQPVVQEGGGSETDFAILDDGAVVAVTRNEAGDETGFGSKICRAEASALGEWRCEHDPRKYDSPLVFRHGADVWLVGRRNVTESGAYDLGLDDLPPAEQAQKYQIDYWSHPKRCALWRVDPDALTVEWVLDLPSKGDTCFASVVWQSEHEAVLYNYTSPLDSDGDPSWVDGQFGPTQIVRQVLRF